MSDTTTTPIRIAVVEHSARADQLVRALHDAGFPAERISVVCPEGCEDALDAKVETLAPAGSKAPAAALSGGAIGALLGGLTAGIGLVASGGTALLVAGPLLGAAGAGAVTGGFLGAMTTRGFEREVADYYDQALSEGKLLVAVDTTPADGVPSAARAERVLEDAGVSPVPLPRG